jgi:hypothetical protein
LPYPAMLGIFSRSMLVQRLQNLSTPFGCKLRGLSSSDVGVIAGDAIALLGGRTVLSRRKANLTQGFIFQGL